MTSRHTTQPSLPQGVRHVLDCAQHLPDTPGVYRMLDRHDTVLYVGKAKRLKRRVLSYTKIEALPLRLKRMVSETVQLEVVNTHTEVEALLLESNLIKRLKPRYNILLRDDKTFPHLYLDDHHDFPRLDKHRGAQKETGTYYGPFASIGAVNRTMAILQKAFLLRNCSDREFAQRTRPCLQYHIKRCTAPCMGYVSQEGYADQINDLKPFLEGKSTEVKQRLQAEMVKASEAQDYERAALFRDRIQAISLLQSKQDINIETIKDADVVACVQGQGRHKGRSCVQIFFFRGGQNFGNRSYFPKHGDDVKSSEILSVFLAQFYTSKPIPKQIFLNQTLADQELLSSALSTCANTKIEISVPQRGDKKNVIAFAEENARKALQRHCALQDKDEHALDSLVTLFDLDQIPERIEIYDNSHTGGTNMVGAMVVATPEGFQKSSYRQFNIRQASASDDYGMMREVIARRFKNASVTNTSVMEEQFPDLLLIDGGQGQLSAVQKILSELGLFENMCVVAISKGPDRYAGREEFHRNGHRSFTLPVNDSTLHYLQRLRDEAHRFAIGVHRNKRKKKAVISALDSIEGIGAKKKKSLLHHFGTVKAIENAGIEDLKCVEGVSTRLATKIYDYFHEDIHSRL